jgi:hypothetical protein
LHIGHFAPLGQNRPSRYLRPDSVLGNILNNWKVLIVILSNT